MILKMQTNYNVTRKGDASMVRIPPTRITKITGGTQGEFGIFLIAINKLKCVTLD
jgi:hypothetical protein